MSYSVVIMKDAQETGAATLMIHVTGAIGVGKTTLVTALSERLGLQALYETAADNPYLDRFYADPPTWAWACQNWFLEEALGQAYQASGDERGLFSGFVWDRPPSERYDLFIPPLEAVGALSRSQALALAAVCDHANAVAPAPTLVVALQASAAQLRERISSRNREYEKGLLDGPFLDDHVARYRQWWRHQPQATLLEIDASQPAAMIVDAVVKAVADAPAS
jgi:deoxyadenosine/deoxycytidine kinase